MRLQCVRSFICLPSEAAVLNHDRLSVLYLPFKIILAVDVTYFDHKLTTYQPRHCIFTNQYSPSNIGGRARHFVATSLDLFLTIQC